ncbi:MULTISPECIES: hypothetical protein [Pseudoalteromonas]|uniref:Uncharacterized protein n=1 Tax=Pseudoalteromonas amylolytica TaxID=1859457 RepID=A0A1S1MWK9_9GAMM|nr:MULTISPECIES: hypothetical protein [Pseudoalteromonas]OHU91846.1 hypothetical protein BFC16_02475 [Pseudoalteromonas sp. JW3]OHU93172.1 hypothetical protein BET10_02385 [Pseudoalteromonas amylolytica]
MSQNEEKLRITNKDELRRRHAGNYESINNGERYLLPYEVQLRNQPPEFFKQLSEYDFLKSATSGIKLTLSGLLDELKCLDDLESGRGFWKNFNESALNKHLNPIIGCDSWKKAYLKINRETDIDKPHHNDMLKCVYLLAHLHKASSSYIRQLARESDVWSTDLRVYYPRKDFEFSEEYSGYLSELYANILFDQPPKIRRLVKCLDVCIEKLTNHADSDWIAPFLKHRTIDSDAPSLKILKFNQIALSTHHTALNSYLQDKISGPFDLTSFDKLKANENDQSVVLIASAQQYELVAALCMRVLLQNPLREENGWWVSEGAPPISHEDMKLCIDAVTNAFSADALNQLKIESDGTKNGKRDTSIPAAVKKLAEQNPETVEEIFMIGSADFARVPELYSHYLRKRCEYAIATIRSSGDLGKSVLSNIAETPQAVVESMQPNPNLKVVLDYIRGNNLNQISTDIEDLERDLMFARLREGEDVKVGIIYQFINPSLPPRRL